MDCKDDFEIFELLQDIETEEFPWEMLYARDFEIIEAPEGFEKRVMKCIYELEECRSKPVKLSKLSAMIPAEILENLIYIVWGVVSVLLGAGFILALNEEHIVSFFNNSPALEQYAEFLQSVAQFIDNSVLNLAMAFEFLLNQALLFLDGYRYFFLLVFVVLVTIQLFIYKRSNVQA